MRDVAFGLPAFGSGVNDWYFNAAGSMRLPGMMLLGKGVAVTTPPAPRTRVAGS